MLAEYDDLPCMFRASFIDGQLVIEPVTAHIYRRTGIAGLGISKIEAIELLKKRIMDNFAAQLAAIDWQARQYIRLASSAVY
jgi:hypothetical protein